MSEVPGYLSFYLDARLAMRTLPRKKADVHIHTIYSDGQFTPEQAVNAALTAGLQTMAITDHNNVRGADEAVNYWLRRNLEKDITVLFGEEVSTKEGHVLAIDITEYIPPGESLEETMTKIHAIQGHGRKGMGFIAHPELAMAKSVRFNDIKRLIASDNPLHWPDGIEGHNYTGHALRSVDGGLIFPGSNWKAKAFFEDYKETGRIGAMIGNSDAHTHTVGNSVTVFDAETFREAVETGETGVMVMDRSYREELHEAVLFLRQAVRYQREQRRLSKAA